MAVPSSLPVFEHRRVAYRRVWRGTVFSAFVLPVLFFVGMGLFVGEYVDRADILGVPYLDYIAAGVLASTVLQVAVAESMWPVMAALKWQRTYDAMRATPLRPRDIVGGELLNILFRSAVPAAAFLAVMAAFGTVHSWWAPLALPVALLLAVAVAAPVLAFAVTFQSESGFVLINRFAVIPATLFAGVFFPVSQLAAPVRLLAYASPLWHAVELCRAATLGLPPPWPPLVHLGYLTIWAVGGIALARARFARRMAD
jgi:lipooligosaccharide transport system permease protein